MPAASGAGSQARRAAVFPRPVAPDNDAELARLVDLYAPCAGSTPQAEHQRAMFAASLHAALALAEIRQLVAMLGFQPQMAQVTSDRHWTWSVRMRRPIDGPAV